MDDVRETLEAFVAEIIPTDEDPGAAEAGTAAQVAAALRDAPRLAAVVVPGLRALDRASRAAHGTPFAGLDAAARQALLVQLARGTAPAGWTVADPAPASFWAVARNLAAACFFGSPTGAALCRFPGPVVDRGGYRHTLVEPDPLARGGTP